MPNIGRGFFGSTRRGWGVGEVLRALWKVACRGVCGDAVSGKYRDASTTAGLPPVVPPSLSTAEIPLFLFLRSSRLRSA